MRTRKWVFLITDGGPTDQRSNAARLVKEGEADKAFSFFAVGVEGANMEMLSQICVRAPLRLDGLKFREPFARLSTSSSSVSHSNPGDAVPLQNPATPDEWISIA